MLLIVQLVQIARAKTTYESMHGRKHLHDESRVTDAVASAIAAGAVSSEGAQVTSDGRGPDPVLSPLDHSAPNQRSHNRKGGLWARCLKLLGVDTFVKTAQEGLDSSRRRGAKPKNPFNRGVVQNCKDFWCEPTPIWHYDRRAGEAMIGGQLVDYYTMYESPKLANIWRDLNRYQSVPIEEEGL